MVSEAFISKKLAELEKLDVHSSTFMMEFSRFFGILEVISQEAYDEGVKFTGVYKQFEDKYHELSNKHSNIIMKQFEEDKVICDRILTSIRKSKEAV